MSDYHFDMKIYTIETVDGIEFVAEFPDLKGCVGSGKNYQEAMEEALENQAVYLETLMEMGEDIPTPTSKYSGKLSLRISPLLHQRVSETAKTMGISINQFIVETLAMAVGNNIKR